MHNSITIKKSYKKMQENANTYVIENRSVYISNNILMRNEKEMYSKNMSLFLFGNL